MNTNHTPFDCNCEKHGECLKTVETNIGSVEGENPNLKQQS